MGHGRYSPHPTPRGTRGKVVQLGGLRPTEVGRGHLVTHAQIRQSGYPVLWTRVERLRYGRHGSGQTVLLLVLWITTASIHCVTTSKLSCQHTISCDVNTPYTVMSMHHTLYMSTHYTLYMSTHHTLYMSTHHKL